MGQRKRDFSVTELIIFIVVIAILAGSMITGFVVLSNEMKAAERERAANQAALQAKLDEIAAKLNGTGGVLSWEDFENELASQLAKQESSYTEALNRALDEFAEKHAGGAGLTEAQIKAIMEEALSGQLTETQVRNIVNNAVRGLDNAPSASEITQIVRQALSSYMTAEQVEAFVGATISGQNEKIQQIVDEARESMQKEFEKLLDTYLGSNENQNEFDSDKIVFSFAAISDIHVKNSTTDEYSTKFQKALEQLRAAAATDDADGLDAVFAVGDLIDDGSTGHYEQMNVFKTVYESVFSPKEVPMIFTVGNHDVEGAYVWNTSTKVNTNKLNAILGDDYFLTDIDRQMLESENNRHCVVDGFHVISVIPQSSSPITYSQSTKLWLDETLAEITEANPDSFVFVLTHPMITGTVYGSELGSYWATSDITDILSKYPQVVTFGGHLHFPLNDPRSIMQTAFTSLGCGSVRYMAIENGGYEDMAGATTMNDKDEFSQGLLVQIDADGNMRITRMDFYNETTIQDAWIVESPKADGSHLQKYTSERGNAENNTAPVMSSNMSVATGDTTSAGVLTTLTFAAATDDEFAHHYVIELKNSEGTTLTTKKVLADFYRHGDPADMKQELSVSLGSLAQGSYSVTVTAYDSWDAESEPASYTFEVGSGGTAPATLPEAYVDLEFTGGTVTDAKGKVTIANNGATVGQTSVTLGGSTYTVDALQVTASGQYVLCTFSEMRTAAQMKIWAQSGFAVEAFYVMGDKGDVQGIVCATEQYPMSTGARGGWGIAENAGRPYFITGATGNKYISGPTATEVTSTTELVHVLAVYDYANKIQCLYINGVPVNTGTAITGEFAAVADAAGITNQFMLGADIYVTAPAHFPSPNMTMVDAKIYSQALSAAQVKLAYDAAVASLSTTVTPEPEPEQGPTVYVDLEFTGGTVTDAKGNVTLTNNGATVGQTSVTLGGSTYTVDALQVTASGQYVLAEFANLADAAAVKTWAESGFAVEAFYVMGDKSGVQGIVCATEQYPRGSGTRGGWGIAENGGKPYFITAASGNAYVSGPTAAAASSTTELVHVLAVYDYANKLQHLYINGVAVDAGKAITGEFAPVADASGITKQFMLGADATTASAPDFLSPNMTMVDAKIYSQALSAEQAKTAYDAAVAALGEPVKPEPEPEQGPTVYVDLEFTGGTVTDAKGNVTLTNNGATVGQTSVTLGGSTYTVDALQVTASGQYVLAEFANLADAAAVKTWAESGFAVEAFYVMGDKSGVQGIVCGTETLSGTRGGWGIAENAGKPYFITAASGNAYVSGPTAAEVTSTTELVHVLAVYDYANKLQHLYINGVAVDAGKAITGEFAPAGAEAFNKFCLGADYRAQANVNATYSIDYACPNMTMVDAKIYSQALTAEQVQTAYANALAAIQ